LGHSCGRWHKRLRTRSRSAGSVDSHDPDSQATNVTFYQSPPITRYLRGLDYRYEGIESVDGETVYVYSVSNRTQLTPADHGLSMIVTSVRWRKRRRDLFILLVQLYNK